MARSNNAITFGSAFNITAAAPIDSRMAVDFESDLYKEGTWPADKAPLYNGMTVTIKETGDIFVLIDKSNYKTKEGWKQVGSGLGTTLVETYPDAVEAATNDNIGQIVYVKTKVYAFSSGETVAYVSTLDEVPTLYEYVDDDNNTVVVENINEVPEGKEYNETKKDNTEYSSGPYIVIGESTLQKLSSASASGDISSDIAQIQTNISNLTTIINNESSIHIIDGDDVETDSVTE